MKFRAFLFVLVVVVLVSLVTGVSRIIRVANAASPPEILDQQQTDTSQAVTVSDFAQSFKPTLTVLTKIDFYVRGTATLWIYPSKVTQDGTIKPYFPALGSAYAYIPDGTPDWRWAEFVFSHPISLLPEHTYFIVVYVNELADWLVSSGDLYARGEAYRFSEVSGDPWRFWEVKPWDFAFKTYGYTPTLTIRTSGVSSHSPVAVTLNRRSFGTVHDSSPLEVNDTISWDDGHGTVSVGIDSSRIFSTDPNTRYAFTNWQGPYGTWSDNPFTTGLLYEDQLFTANFRIQYLTNMTFRDNSGAVDINPTYIEALAPNGSLVTFSSFKNQWMDIGTWRIKRVIWQGNNVKPLTDPIYTPTAGGEWSINCRVFSVDFTGSFRDSDGADLYVEPSSFKIGFPNGTTSAPLKLGSYLMQNGTISWSSIIWQGSDVTPSTSFDASNGNPTVNCKIYSLTVNPSFYDNTGTYLITPSSWSLTLPNSTVIALSNSVTWNQVQIGDYWIQSVTWKGRNVPRSPASIELTSDTVWNPKVNCILPVNVFLFLSTSTSYFGFKIEIDGNLTCNELGVTDAAILLSYSVTAGKSWNDITLTNTVSNGRYSAVWMPQATGNYVVKAVWAGNATFPASTKTINLAVIPFEERNVFSAISNSTVSELSFESVQRELTFTVEGPVGSTGYVDVYIAKTLIGDIEGVEVKINGTEIEYDATSLDDSWLIHFTYQHSSHTVAVSLGAAAPPSSDTIYIDPIPTALVIAILAAALVVGVLMRRKRQQKSQARAS